MLGQAKSAQEKIGQSNQAETEVRQTQATAVAGVALESMMRERNELAPQRPVAEAERVKAVGLLDQGTELAAGSEQLAPETATFLQAAGRTVEERQNVLASLEERLTTLDADPAVRDVLYQEAKDEGRRIQTQKEYQECYYIKTQDGQHRGTMHEVVRQVSPDYETKIAGTNIGDSALCQLEGFAFSASGVARGEGPKGSIDEAEDAVQRMTTIREEIETGNPDVQKVDSVLAEFMYKRLEHFFATLDQRVEARAQQLVDHYEANPDDAAKYPNRPTTLDGWKQQLNNSMGNIRLKMQEATQVMESDEFKARELARIGEYVFQIASCGCGINGDQYPYHPDNYKEPVKYQEAA